MSDEKDLAREIQQMSQKERDQLIPEGSLGQNSAPEEEKSFKNPPHLPYYIIPAPTSFRIAMCPNLLRRLMEYTFICLGISFSTSEEHCFGWEIRGIALGAIVKSEACVFLDIDPNYCLIEIRRMEECRYSFNNLANQLTTALDVEFIDGSRCLPFAPPPLPDPPELDVSDPNVSDPDVSDIDVAKESTFYHISGFFEEDAPISLKKQGLRAFNAVISKPDFDKDDPNYQKIIITIIKLLKSTDVIDLRVFSMTAVATIASYPFSSRELLDEAFSIVEKNIDDEDVFVRREAMHIAQVLAKKGEDFLQKFLEKGLIGKFKSEARGPKKGYKDIPTIKYAYDIIKLIKKKGVD
jgi:hypothetical protein